MRPAARSLKSPGGARRASCVSRAPATSGAEARPVHFGGFAAAVLRGSGFSVSAGLVCEFGSLSQANRGCRLLELELSAGQLPAYASVAGRHFPFDRAVVRGANCCGKCIEQVLEGQGLHDELGCLADEHSAGALFVEIRHEGARTATLYPRPDWPTAGRFWLDANYASCLPNRDRRGTPALAA